MCRVDHQQTHSPKTHSDDQARTPHHGLNKSSSAPRNHQYLHAFLRHCILLVVTCAILVQWPTLPLSTEAGQNTTKKTANQQVSKPTATPLKDLPQPVLEMRDAIITAVQTANIDDLRTALEWNELSPDLGLDQDTDPIEHWKSSSHNGHGYETLAILANLLAGPPARLPIGRDFENNDVFVWPFLSELEPKDLTPAQHVLLFRILPKDQAESFLKTGTWPWYRLAIGADGTWHAFSQEPNLLPDNKNAEPTSDPKEDSNR